MRELDRFPAMPARAHCSGSRSSRSRTDKHFTLKYDVQTTFGCVAQSSSCGSGTTSKGMPTLPANNTCTATDSCTLVVWRWNPGRWTAARGWCAVRIHASAYTFTGPALSTWFLSNAINQSALSKKNERSKFSTNTSSVPRCASYKGCKRQALEI